MRGALDSCNQDFCNRDSGVWILLARFWRLNFWHFRFWRKLLQQNLARKLKVFKI
ncbi:hypothetical protein [Helicobacter sp. 'CLO3_human']|uniref:hypothetical protein n=1 Tax=Helicobacter sp. 'CLO3_human' TaxID=2020249 RepID=UPI0013159D09|nr:hypothetical protein [Helicobacter sp. 'CLO3_human']